MTQKAIAILSSLICTFNKYSRTTDAPLNFKMAGKMQDYAFMDSLVDSATRTNEILTNLGESESMDSVSSSKFQLAENSLRSTGKLNDFMSKSIPRMTAVAHSLPSNHSINDSSESDLFSNMPNFEVSGSSCKLSGTLSIGNGKLDLKNLLLSLFHVQVGFL